MYVQYVIDIRPSQVHCRLQPLGRKSYCVSCQACKARHAFASKGLRTPIVLRMQERHTYLTNMSAANTMHIWLSQN